ncbi:MAG TPA: hypothetical protein VFK02_02985 [Kofleriaceae bacterium]|nr:hypothetical protein [Kofleriaceae bacterium]
MRLAALVEDVASRLEAPTEAASPSMIFECNAALESCLEALRDASDCDNRVRTAHDDLRRLYRLLKLVDGADVSFVLRQIRRVLGRLDVRGGCIVGDSSVPRGPAR